MESVKTFNAILEKPKVLRPHAYAGGRGGSRYTSNITLSSPVYKLDYTENREVNDFLFIGPFSALFTYINGERITLLTAAYNTTTSRMYHNIRRICGGARTKATDRREFLLLHQQPPQFGSLRVPKRLVKRFRLITLITTCVTLLI